MWKILLLAALTTALWSGEASAHARLLKAAPRVGAAVPSPSELRLWFSETVDLTHSSIAVSGPGGAPIAVGALRLENKDQRVVIAPLTGRLAPGRYRVEWNVTSTDTHHTDGDFTFTVKP
ncbi:MAG: yobA [Phenylobacterium sp.]|nr:yobA [Phenylobacterium sp.]